MSRKSSEGNAVLGYSENLIGQSVWLACPSFSDEHHSSHLPIGRFKPNQGGALGVISPRRRRG
jgi:hypothetical protein